jgi:hypothetical protein
MKSQTFLVFQKLMKFAEYKWMRFLSFYMTYDVNKTMCKLQYVYYCLNLSTKLITMFFSWLIPARVRSAVSSECTSAINKHNKTCNSKIRKGLRKIQIYINYQSKALFLFCWPCIYYYTTLHVSASFLGHHQVYLSYNKVQNYKWCVKSFFLSINSILKYRKVHLMMAEKRGRNM